jgi:hypothetical protein
MFNVAWDLWQNQNAVNNDKENQEKLHSMGNVNPDICVLFQQGPGSSPERVQYLFAGSVEDLLESSICKCLLWLKTVQNIRDMESVHHTCQRRAFQASA